MLLEGILDKIGFTDEMKQQYEIYKTQAGDIPDVLAESFMKDEKDIATVIEEMDAHDMGGVPQYAKYLLFYLSCTGPLYKKYKEKGYSEELYIDTMKDIVYKINENIDVYEYMGISCPNWFSNYFKLTRFGFGRMQFDITTHPCEAVEVAGRIVNEGDFIIKGHVPSSGPLLREDYMKSYKAAYKFVKDKFEFKGDLLPVEYWSWMLFPHYKDFFSENSNSAKFIADYKVFGYYETDVFHDEWRFFGKYAGQDNLPTNTSLQRKFVEYMGQGKTYGYGKGIFLFDGENIIK